MDLNAYLLDSVFHATTPREETAPAAQIRRQVIQAIFDAHAPTDAMQALVASNCVALQFLLIAATKDTFDAGPDPVQKAKRLAATLSIGRALSQSQRQLARLRAPAKKPSTKGAAPPQPPDPTHLPPPAPAQARPTASPRPKPNPHPALQWPGPPPTTLTASSALLAAMPARPMPHATG